MLFAGFLSLLIGGAAYCFLERFLFDGSIALFELIQKGHLFIPFGRTAVVLNQILPWLGVKGCSSLHALMNLYVINDVLIYALGAFLLIKISAKPWRGLALMAAYLILAKNNYYVITYSGLITLPLILLFAETLEQGAKTNLQKFGLGVLMLLIVWAHPVSAMGLLLVLVYDMLAGGSSRRIVAVISVLLFLVLVKTFCVSSYEQAKLDSLMNAANPDKAWVSLGLLLRSYAALFLAMLICLATFVRVVRLSLLAYTSVLIAIILVVYVWVDPAVYDPNKLTQPLAFTLIYMAIHALYKFKQGRLIWVLGILLLPVIYFEAESNLDLYNRFHSQQELIEKVIDQAKPDVVNILPQTSINNACRFSSYPQEALIYSAIEGPANTQWILYTPLEEVPVVDSLYQAGQIYFGDRDDQGHYNVVALEDIDTTYFKKPTHISTAFLGCPD